MKRCGWVNELNPIYLQYHDKEWGVPVHDDRKLFEMLCLEVAQAGLSWETILKKRKGYLKCFVNFTPSKLVRFSDNKLERILKDEGIVRNRLKVFSVRENARAFLEVKKEFKRFSEYIWGFVDGKPIINRWKRLDEVPATTEISDRMSIDLKERGFKFVGSTICYAFMQAVGMVNDHVITCYRYKECNSITTRQTLPVGKKS